MSKVYLVTGANSGLGKETVKQLAALPTTATVYLACRSFDKATRAIKDLSETVDTNKLQYLHFDASCSQAEIAKGVVTLQQGQHSDNDHTTTTTTTRSLASTPAKIDGIVMNAGGWGVDSSNRPIRPNGVIEMVQINLLGHIHLLEALQRQSSLQDNCRLVYSGSENARGVLFGLIVPSPRFLHSTADSIQQQLVSRTNILLSYCAVKGLAALYFAAFARQQQQQQQYRVLTVSPGFTVGTAILEQPGAPLQLRMIPTMVKKVGLWLGIAHNVSVGARRYVEAVTGLWDERFQNGAFVASARLVSGPVCDQTELPSGQQYSDRKVQDLVYRVLRKYVDTDKMMER